jgi:hypothetical protein
MAARFILFSAILIATAAQQNVADPINDFCRRHQHQTCIVDSKLYIDGGKMYSGGNVDNNSIAEQSEFVVTWHRKVADGLRHSTVMGGRFGYQKRLQVSDSVQ